MENLLSPAATRLTRLVLSCREPLSGGVCEAMLQELRRMSRLQQLQLGPGCRPAGDLAAELAALTSLTSLLLPPV